ncbi:hypothetical protein AGMMS50256_13050 [Betaproteobacteria bacterium]|nr:hypothetical protein AGMMS50256_13050 [Betaproteobacteria bacterium]
MEDEDFELAYELLWEIKQGKMAGRMVSEKEWQLMQLLAADLLPGRKFDEDNFPEFIHLIAKEDTKWNHALQEALCTYYDKVEAGETEVGIAHLKMFIAACPSRWYRSFAESELTEN